MVYAAKLEKSAEFVYPAEVAIDCIALFSSTVISRPMRSFASILKSANERMTLVIPTPSDHPVFTPMYRLVSASTPPSAMPVIPDRSVSWGMSPR